jgi:hypothetical protein
MSSYTTTDFERGMDVGRQVEATRLKAENTKLRGIASLMWRELHAEQGSAQRRMDIADRMRELGVEAEK